ncbi:MAG: P1 family peptidase [Hyphomonadaceae bacterium]|nr:P1 family peptidase [Hyphomonadaceae bacterium]
MGQAGPHNTITDIDGLTVGNAHDAGVVTGVSVILAEAPVTAAVAVAGGGPGTRETDLLKSGMLVQQVDAVVLSGGSAYGLAAADGVAAELGAQGHGFGLIDLPGVPKTPIVPSAILYDLANGGDKAWGAAPPYGALGRAALHAAAKDFALGRAGAGYGARAGQLPGGLGSASWQTDDGITVGALVAVNCFGATQMPGTDCFWAWPYEVEGEFGGVRPPAGYSVRPEDWGAAKINPAPGQNTTIACVATDVALTASQAQRVADMALAGLARAIRPVFAPVDGDTVFALSTARGAEREVDAITLSRIGELAAGCLARAVARGVWLAGQSRAGT